MSSIEEGFKQYIGIKNPHYALMIKGSWGCGKTYFFKNILLQILKDRGFDISYISMTNIEDSRELKKEIVQNILDNDIKNFAVEAINTLKDIFQGTLNTKGLNINIQDINELYFNNWIKNTKNKKIIIVDDLERLSIDIFSILNFFTCYLDNDNVYVLFLSNEEELLNKNTDYLKVKEKIIGKTYLLQTDVKSIVDKLVDEIFKDNKYRILVKSTVFEILDKLKIENLRVIQRALKKVYTDINEIISHQVYSNYSYSNINIYGQICKKEEYIQKCVQMFLLVDIEEQLGYLNKDNIEKLLSKYFEGKFVNEEDNENKIENLKIDFRVLKNFIPLNKTDDYIFWKNYLIFGYLNIDMLNEFISFDFSNFLNLEREDDVLLELMLDYYYMDKEDFYNKQNKLIENLKDCKYNTLGSLYSAFRLFLEFESTNILSEKFKSQEDILIFFRGILKDIHLQIENVKYYDFLHSDFDFSFFMKGYKGVGFFSEIENPFMKQFKTELKVVYDKVYKDKMIDVFLKLLDRIELDNNQFENLRVLSSERLIFCSEVENKMSFNMYPILAYIDFNKIWKILEGISLEKQRIFIWILKERYGCNIINMDLTYLKDEIVFLEKLLKTYTEIYNNSYKNKDNKNSVYKNIIENLKVIIDYIDKNISK